MVSSKLWLLFYSTLLPDSPIHQSISGDYEPISRSSKLIEVCVFKIILWCYRVYVLNIHGRASELFTGTWYMVLVNVS